MSPNLKGVKGGINRIQPSLGVGYLGAVLEREGHEVHIRDTALEGHHIEVPLEDGKTIIRGESNEAIYKYISSLNPDIVGISILFSNSSEHAHTIARIVKEVNPNIKVIVGGNHITNSVLDYKYALAQGDDNSNIERTLYDMQDPNIDYAMTGECDLLFTFLVNSLLNNKEPRDISGLVYRNDKIESLQGNVFVNTNNDKLDIRQLPWPSRHLVNMEGYFEIGLFHSAIPRSKRIYNVMASRGCPEKCTFCTTPEMWGSKVRWRDPKDICEEIKAGIKQYHIGEVQFEDDSLMANRTLLMELCDLLEPLGILWCTPNGTKANYHLGKQPQMFERMAKAGCYQVTLACESGVQRVLDKVIQKNLRLEQIRLAIENAKEAGLMVHTFWIVGFPGETREEMEQTIEFAAQSGADSYSISILSPLPGTSIYRQVVKENLWWDPSKGINDMLYRTSLIKADGFSSPEEFQAWVDEKGIYLNSLLEKRYPHRAKLFYESGDNYLSQQDAFKVKRT
jgi:radical SAM superfamily enzyme YgiQ (UPF0313 family)